MARRKRGFGWVREDVDEEAVEPAVRRNQSEHRRQTRALEQLALRLAALHPSERKRLELDQQLDEQVVILADLPPKPARRRQLLRLKTLLRVYDTDAILAALDGDSNADVRAHQAERWRDRIMKDGNEALEAFFEAYEVADRQHLRSVSREAQKEGASKTRIRRLFKGVLDAITRTPEPVADEPSEDAAEE